MGMNDWEEGTDKEFTVAVVHKPSSNAGREGARVVQWGGGKAPEETQDVHTITKFGKLECTCFHGLVAEAEHRQAACIHTAIFKTWRRQGRPNSDSWNNFEPRVYYVTKLENGEHQMGYYDKGVKKPLSTVERVNAA